MLHHDFAEFRCVDFSDLSFHQISRNLRSQCEHLVEADACMTTSRIKTPYELILMKIFIPAIPFMHLNCQIDRLKCGKPYLTIQTLPSPTNGILFDNIPRVGDLRVKMITKRAMHKKPSL